VGISLLGLVGASVASAVVSRLSGKQQQGQDEVRSEMKQLVAEVASLREELAQAGVIKPRTPSSAASESDSPKASP
jgi:hypothetical protein